jgi:hypothetical protein
MKEHMERGLFIERTGLKFPSISTKITKIVAMKDLVKIDDLFAMSKNYMMTLLRSITLEGDNTIRPYENAVIETCRIDPHQLLVGQTFVERGKYQNLVENITNIFESFAIGNGFAKCGSYIVIGRTADGQRAIAHYLSPIVEIFKNNQCLIDGVHRNFITRAAGTTIQSIVIKNVSVDLPCEFGKWDNIRVVNEKPPREERFINLDKYFFRNLSWSGIDG